MSYDEYDEEIIDERSYVVNFSKPIYGRGIPRTKRTPKAIKYLRQFVIRHMKVEKVIIDPLVNEALWRRGPQHPMRKIRIRAVKTDEETVEVFLV
ncbi:MAG: 50S ribosomal protein L31e [Candidatus Hodarchaeales archaeon]